MRTFRYSIPAGGSQSIHHAGSFIRGINGAKRYQVQIDEDAPFEFETGMGYTAPEPFRQVRIINTDDATQVIEVAITTTRVEDNRLIATQPVAPKPAERLAPLTLVNGSGTIPANLARRQLMLRADRDNAGVLSVEGLPLYPGDAMELDVTGEVAVSAENQPGLAAIGDAVGGGIYAGKDTIGGIEYHIIVGDAEAEAYGLEWKTSRTTTAGTDSDTDGLANTLAMEAAGIADHPAAEYCLNFASGGHDDWHMPARSQVTLIYNNLAGHPEFADLVASGGYAYLWTSSEYSINGAWTRDFSDGSESFDSKDNTARKVRPIRRIAVGNDAGVTVNDGDRLHVAEVI